jgi:alanine racemase
MMSRVATRPTWAEVSLATLRQNFRTVAKHVGAGVTVCAVVKADAYGHGAVECSRALQSEGAKWLGVTSLDEAIPLRETAIETRILLMTACASLPPSGNPGILNRWNAPHRPTPRATQYI